ncbi:hypothetical protein, partial [Acidianus sp. RZ1]|uniref:hypothetical protein n=1 Tax=Acidianus sp. RZ1 TaxID=1540082 RepID=UPI001C0FD094
LFQSPLVIVILYYIILGIGYVFRRAPEATVVAFFLLTFSVFRINFFGTDEIMIDYYSAYLFLHGLNPYIPYNTANVYQFYHVSSLIYGTPITTGGVVTNLNYPSLSFLLLIPAVILHISPNFVPLSFYFATIILLYFILMKHNEKSILPALIAPLLININYFYYPTGGVPDVIWVFFLLLSLSSNNDTLRGIAYGLSASVKQFPLALLPFYIIYLYKERKNYKKFSLYSALTFLFLNGYFIILSPFYYFRDILYPVTASLIGIGFGPSVFSFGGIFYVYKQFFLVAMILVFISEIYVFMTKYRDFKLDWVVFPYFVFLFEYRVLWNYLMYWSFLPYSFQGKSRSRKFLKSELKTAAISSLILISLTLFYHFNFSFYTHSVHVEVLKMQEVEGRVYSILLNVSYDPNVSTLPSRIFPQFRILPNSPMITANGYLWKSNATWLSKNSWEIVNISSPISSFEPHLCRFAIETYYGNLQSFCYINPYQFS